MVIDTLAPCYCTKTGPLVQLAKNFDTHPEYTLDMHRCLLRTQGYAYGRDTMRYMLHVVTGER